MADRTSSQDFFVAPPEARRLASDLTPESMIKIDMNLDSAKRFLRVRERYLAKQPADWSKVVPPDVDNHPISLFEELEPPQASDIPLLRKLLSQLVILQLNGGTGEEMGFSAPKSSVSLGKATRNEADCPLECVLQHVLATNTGYGVDIPVLLLNSPMTHNDTITLLARSELSKKVRVFHLQQSIFPTCTHDTLSPIPQSKNDKGWYPPGSGEAFRLVCQSEVFNALKSEGKKYLFLSNIENLGRSIDPRILKALYECSESAILECTERLSVDTYGGILVQDERTGHLNILEINQIPYNKRDEFAALHFPFYNTNNIWVKLDDLNERWGPHAPEPEPYFIVKHVNTKTPNGVIRGVRIETPASQAVFSFNDKLPNVPSGPPKVRALIVPRDRYVKLVNTEDLLAIQSDIYVMHHGVLLMNEKRVPPTTPLIKLGDAVEKEFFKEIGDYEKRFRGIPNILELEHLTISGDVTIGANVTFKGTVIIIAEHGQKIDIPNGTVLENKIVTGKLQVLKY